MQCGIWEQCSSSANTQVRRRTDYGQREPIPKGSNLVIGATAIDLEYGHAYELCQERCPQPPTVSVGLHTGQEPLT